MGGLTGELTRKCGADGPIIYNNGTEGAWRRYCKLSGAGTPFLNRSFRFFGAVDCLQQGQRTVP